MAGVASSRLACGGIGLAVALGCSLAARRGRSAPVASAAAWTLAASVLVVPPLLPVARLDGLTQGALLASALFVAIAVDSGLAGAAREYLLVAVVALLASVPLLVWALVVASGLSFVGDLLTAAAGNPPVQAADTDAVLTVAGCALGGVFGLALAFWRYVSEHHRKADGAPVPGRRYA